MATTLNAEKQRLVEAHQRIQRWKKWGPYLSERQWGTVREDYSADGNAWNYFPFEQAHMRAYRWGEDGLGGFSDDRQRLCMGVALWNGKDPILKERLFGLANEEGNHGEDVKEIYYYLDATPTHSYMKMLYKYPQAEFPYKLLKEMGKKRSREETEYEIMDTGIFDQDRYFDVFIEYAKASPDDILLKITVHNRGPDDAAIHVIPQLWFRNTWSWTANGVRPSLIWDASQNGVFSSSSVGSHLWQVEGTPEWMFTENDTHVQAVWGLNDQPGYQKDAFHRYIIKGEREAINPDRNGTKAAARQVLWVPAGQAVTVRCRLHTSENGENPFADFDAIFDLRKQEADEFYGEIQKDISDADVRNVQRQALAGMVWNKQYYNYDVRLWLQGDPVFPPPPVQRKDLKTGRNVEWMHLVNGEVISMPDKWEYPWYAAWDLAFHTIPFALIDPDFAKSQLILLTREWYMHPNGQMPAYEWKFSDVNPPVHAWAAWRVYQIDRKYSGKGDVEFLERVFHKLMLNFTWWVNRKDSDGRNIFQGGFLGLDNIGLFDRSKELPLGGHIDQSDATSWMGMYSLNLLRISLELALHNKAYEDIATKFFEHFLHIAEAMTQMGGDDEDRVGLWNEEDQFYYDHLHMPDGHIIPLKIRSIVGLIPMFAVETIEPELLVALPDFHRRLRWFENYRPDLAQLVSRWQERRVGERRLLSLLRGSRMKKLLKRMLDETEFLSDYGIRALSKVHEENPYTFQADGEVFCVKYIPGDSDSGMFGGNSNWRGPIWPQMNYLIIESLQKFHYYYGDDFLVECPTGSGQMMTIEQISEELTRRLSRIFLKDGNGHRAVFGNRTKFQTDPHFKDYVLFYEYFHGDTGFGLGASHQCGWTGLIAKLLHPKRQQTLCAAESLEQIYSRPTQVVSS